MTKEKLQTPASFTNYILDMDGTLYKPNLKLLTEKVLLSTTEFVSKKEGCGLTQAAEIVQQAQKDKVGISRVLAAKYQLSRTQIFQNTWTFEPDEIVKDFDHTTVVLQKLKAQNKNLILLTAAPRIWMVKVLDYIGINDCFSQQFTGEDFGGKIEIFRKLSTSLLPNQTISIGDQVDTDIVPASKVGFNTFIVTKPSDLLNLI